MGHWSHAIESTLEVVGSRATLRTPFLYQLPMYRPQKMMMNAEGVLEITFSDVSRMEKGEVVRVYPIEWDTYFKTFHCRFRVQCPWYKCHRINKHGTSFKNVPAVLEISDFRACDFCGKEYKIELSQNRAQLE